jgi:hypothetical protein
MHEITELTGVNKSGARISSKWTYNYDPGAKEGCPSTIADVKTVWEKSP